MLRLAATSIVLLALLSGCSFTEEEADYYWGKFGGKADAKYPDLNAGGSGGGW